MSEKRKLSDLFPLRETKLSDIYPFTPSFGTGYGGGYLNPLSSTRATPVYIAPVPTFSVVDRSDDISLYTQCAAENGSFGLSGTCDIAFGANGFYEFRHAQTGTVIFGCGFPLGDFTDPAPGVLKYGYYRIVSTGISSNSQPGPDVVSFVTSFILTNTTDGTTYNSLLWTVKNVQTNTFLPTGNGQTYTITTTDPTAACTFEVVLQATYSSDQPVATGTAYMTITALVTPVAIIHSTDGNYTGTTNAVTHTYTVGDSALWSYDNVSTGTYDSHSWVLVPSQSQVDSVDNLSGSWDTTTAGTFTHTLTLNLLSGFDVVSSVVLVVTVIVNHPPAVAIISGAFGSVTGSPNTQTVTTQVAGTTFYIYLANGSTGFFNSHDWIYSPGLISVSQFGSTNDLTATQSTAGSTDYAITLNLRDVSNVVLSSVTITFPVTWTTPPTIAAISDFSGLHITDYTDSGTSPSTPWQFTVTNSSTGPYHHFRWTKVPDQLTNIVYSGNDLSAFWTPTYDQDWNFQLTLYDAADNILDTRTVHHPRTITGGTGSIPAISVVGAPGYSFVETRLINTPIGTGSVGGYNVKTGIVTCTRYDLTNPRPKTTIPAYNNHAPGNAIGQHWTGVQPVPNHFIWFGPTGPVNLAGQHNQWPFFGPGLLNYSNSPVRPIGLEYWDFEFDRGPTSTVGDTTYQNVSTQLPIGWNIKHDKASDCYFSNTTDWTLTQFPVKFYPHQHDVNMGGISGDSTHSDAIFTFKVNMATGIDQRLYISFYDCIVFVKPDDSFSLPYEGNPSTGTLVTQMRIDSSYYTIANNVATVRLRRGQLTTNIGTVASFDYLCKLPPTPPIAVAKITVFGGTYITDFTDTTKDTTSFLSTFTATNTSIGTYDHFKWTKVPDQLTNIVQSGNNYSATWTPTYAQDFTFELTLYTSSNDVIDRRRVVLPRTIGASFAPPVYGVSDQPTSGTLDVYRAPIFAFGGSSSGPTKGINSGKLRIYRSANASDPLPTVTLPLYISTATGTPVTQQRIAWGWESTTFPVSWTFTAPGNVASGGSFPGGANSGTGSGTGNYTWSNGLNMVEFTFNIPVDSYLDINKTASLCPTTLNKRTITAASVYDSDTENRYIESFNTDGTLSLSGNTSSYTFKISASYRQNELYLIFEGSPQIFNVLTSTWDTKLGVDGSTFSSEMKLTNYYTTLNGYNYIQIKGNGVIVGFSELTFP